MPSVIDSSSGTIVASTIVINKFPLQFVDENNMAKLNKDNMKMIYVHHAAAKSCTIEDIHTWHLTRPTLDGHGAGYNFFIRKNGQIYEGRGLKYKGCHTGGVNGIGLGICFEGNYEEEASVPAAQISAFVLLSEYLTGQCKNIPKNKGAFMMHRNVPGASTACPGKNFPWNTLMASVTAAFTDKVPVAASYSAGPYGANTGTMGVHKVTGQWETWATVGALYSISPELLATFNKKKITDKLYPGDVVNYPNAIIQYAEIVKAFETNADAAMLAYSEYQQLGEYASKYSPQTAVAKTTAYIATTSSKPTITDYSGGTQAKQGTGNDNRVLPNQNLIGKTVVYNKMKLIVVNGTTTTTFRFKVDPSSMTTMRNRELSQIKTKGGTIISDNGPSLAQISLSGAMLDYGTSSEKYDFTTFYKNNIENGKYSKILLDFLGVLSLVEINNVTISDDASNNKVKRYSMSITVINEDIYDANGIVSTTTTTKAKPKAQATIGQMIFEEIDTTYIGG